MNYKLQAIADKYAALQYNDDNYAVGGGTGWFEICQSTRDIQSCFNEFTKTDRVEDVTISRIRGVGTIENAYDL